jgi:hypothetical protein
MMVVAAILVMHVSLMSVVMPVVWAVGRLDFGHIGFRGGGHKTALKVRSAGRMDMSVRARGVNPTSQQSALSGPR